MICRANELYHDLQAGQFDEVHRNRHRVERQFWESEVVPRLLASCFRRGLDLCTGTGFVPRILLQHLGPLPTVLCMDLSGEALQRTRAALGPLSQQVEIQACDVQALPLPDNSIDWVTLNAGLHHIPRPEATLREIDRVLTPGGYFCLGYEPNALYFRSRPLVLFGRIVWHVFWYASPKRNLWRLRSWLGQPVDRYEACEHLARVNEVLLGERLIEQPLTLNELRSLVDAHTRDNGAHEAGFSPAALIEQWFPAYTVEVLLFGDYGGEMLRGHPYMRAAVDRCLAVLSPGKGQLFSWILRKPAPTVRA